MSMHLLVVGLLKPEANTSVYGAVPGVRRLHLNETSNTQAQLRAQRPKSSRPGWNIQSCFNFYSQGDAVPTTSPGAAELPVYQAGTIGQAARARRLFVLQCISAY
jgi:hypothetical protein